MAWGAFGEAVQHVRVLFETGAVGGLIDSGRKCPEGSFWRQDELAD
jgi:hypothetical protein